MNLYGGGADVACVPDADRDTVYAAEESVPVPARLRFHSFADAEAFVRDTVDRRYWHRRCGPMADLHPVIVLPSRSESRSSTGLEDGTWTIRMARAHWNALVLAHELAHVAAWWRHGVGKGHAEQFRSEYLSILRHAAPELAGPLARAFADAGLAQPVDTSAWEAAPFSPACPRIRGAIALGPAAA